MNQSTVAIKTKSRDEIAKAYSSPPLWYDARGFLILNHTYRSSLRYQIKFFGNNMGTNHLDVAIGSGTLLDIILKWKKIKRSATPEMIHGFDYAESMLCGARGRFKKNDKVKLQRADAAAMPYANESFDTINIANAIHCFPDINTSLKEVHRVLKKDGTVAVNVLLYPRGNAFQKKVSQTINDWGIKKGILVTPYEYDDIKNKIDLAGFEIVSEVIQGNTFNALLKRK